jgi:hypothetical protein
MPNWVYNHIRLSGDAETLTKFWEQATKPHPTAVQNPTMPYETKDGEWVIIENNEFSFWNFVAPPESSWKDYFSTANGSAPEGNWYNWNIANWGTKWDTDLDDFDTQDECITLSFQTAWSPPSGVYEAMVKQYPTLDISIEWEEEQGFGAELESDGEGGLVLVKEWDIPESHADYVDRDREDSCNCASDDDQEYWYDDCPNKAPDIEDGHLRPIENLAFEPIS